MGLLQMHQGAKAALHTVTCDLRIRNLVAQLYLKVSPPPSTQSSHKKREPHSQHGLLSGLESSTYKYGTIRGNIRIRVVHMVDTAIIHHTGGKIVIDLLVGKVDSIGVHDF